MKPAVAHSGLAIFTAAISCLAISLLCGCGDPPTTAMDWVGSIEVEGKLLPDSSSADSISIKLDGNNLGYFPCPHILTDLFAGTHQVEVTTIARYEQDTLQYFSEPKNVTVEPGQTVSAVFTLATDIPESPYAGYMAPDFQLYDLDSNLVSLSGLADQVVLLYFFAST